MQIKLKLCKNYIKKYMIKLEQPHKKLKNKEKKNLNLK